MVEVDLSSADMTGVDLTRANLDSANLTGVNLTSSKLNSTNLDGAKITEVNLGYATFEPTSPPDKAFLSTILNMQTVRFGKGKHAGLVLLIKRLKEVGLRELEREATYTLEKVKTEHLSPSLEKYSRLLFFEWTSGFGLYPGRCLIILICLIPIFAIFYLFAIYKRTEILNANSLAEIQAVSIESGLKSELEKAWVPMNQS